MGVHAQILVKGITHAVVLGISWVETVKFTKIRVFKTLVKMEAHVRTQLMDSTLVVALLGTLVHAVKHGPTFAVMISV